MANGSKNSTSAKSVSVINQSIINEAQKRYEFSTDPRAWKPTRKEEWIFPVEDEKSIKELKEKEAQAFLQSDEFFASWDAFCNKLDNLTEKLGLSAPQAKTVQLSALQSINLAA